MRRYLLARRGKHCPGRLHCVRQLHPVFYRTRFDRRLDKAGYARFRCARRLRPGTRYLQGLALRASLGDVEGGYCP